MKNYIFGEKINYEHLPPEFILIGLLKRFDNRYQSRADSHFKGMSWMQLYFLNSISLFKQPPSIREMADFIGCSHQNANRLCLKLIKEEYITSVQDKDDKRKQCLYLTEKGKKIIEVNNFGKGKNVLDMFNTITEEEIQSAIEIIYKLTKKLEEND